MGAAPQKAIDFVGCKSFLKNAFHYLGIVHQAGTLAEQVLEFVDQFDEFLRLDGAQVLSILDDFLQFLVFEEFQQFAGYRFPHGQQHGRRLLRRSKGACGLCVSRIELTICCHVSWTSSVLRQ